VWRCISQLCAPEATGFKYSRVPTCDPIRSNKLARLANPVEIVHSKPLCKTVNHREFFADMNKRNILDGFVLNL